MGGGRLNIGLGYVNSYKNWQAINASQFLGSSCARYRRNGNCPSIEELKKNKSVRAWRLPMGFTAWPPWRPGVLFTGDSRNRQSRPPGRASPRRWNPVWLPECAMAALENGGPDDFTNYAQRMEAAWGWSTGVAGTSTNWPATRAWRGRYQTDRQRPLPGCAAALAV